MIRLACNRCDASEDEIPDLKPALDAVWTRVEEVQSYADAIEEVDFDDHSRSVFDWQTHLGMCPRFSEVDF